MPIYQRPNITLATIDLLKKQTQPLYKIITIGSCKLDKLTAKKAGVEYLNYRNAPLSNKWQFGVTHAKKYNPDAILINGSDSWLTTNWCEKMGKFIRDGYHLVGKTTWCQCRINPGKPLLILQRFQSMHREDPIGAGRLFSKSILDAMNWRLFPSGLQSSLDGKSYKYMLAIARNKKIKIKIKIANEIEDAILMGVKSNTWPSKHPFKLNFKKTDSKPDSIKIENPKLWLKENFPGSIKIFRELVPGVKI